MAIDVKLTLSDQATRAYNQFVGNVNKQAATMDNTMKSLGSAVGAAFSVGAIASFMRTAADANLQVAKLDQTLHNTGLTGYRTELLETSKALRDKTAVDDDEIVNLQAQLVAYTGNINAVRQLTPAILDLAAGTGMSVEAAGKLVGKSQEGTEGLKRLGIVIGDTTSDEERLARITEEVTKRYGGMAEAFANTDAGGIKKLSNAMEDLEESAGNVFLKVLMPSLPGILKMLEGAAFYVDKLFAVIKMNVATIMTGLITPFAAVEKLMNELGISSSHVLQNMMQSGIDQVGQAFDDLTHGAELANQAVATTGTVVRSTNTEIVSMKDNIKNLQAELDKLTPGTQAYMDVLIKLNAVKIKSNELDAEAAIRARYLAGIEVEESEAKFASMFRGQQAYEIQSTTSLQQNLAIQNKWSAAFTEIDSKNKQKNREREIKRLEDQLAYQTGLYANYTNALQTTLQTVLVDKFTEILGNQNSVLEMFLGSVGQNLIAWGAAQVSNAILSAIIATTTASAALAAITAEMVGVLAISAPTALAVNIASFGAAGGAAAATFATAAASQLSAMAAVAAVKFHGGGAGFFDAPASEETMVKIRGQEKIRVTTPEQEGFGEGRGNTIVINFNHPVNGEEFIRSGIGSIMRKLGVEDITEVRFNQRSALAI